MRFILLSLALAGASAAVPAKLPPPDDAAKAKAAETTARNAWQARVDAFQLCRAQDRVAGAYRKTAAARPAGGTAAVPGVAASAPSAPTVATAVPAVPAASATPPSANAPTPAAAVTAAVAAPTPGVPASAAAPTVATPPIPPCMDPGPFAYAPPEQKPLETSGAHSPAATATSPPSVRAPQAEMTPGSKK